MGKAKEKRHGGKANPAKSDPELRAARMQRAVGSRRDAKDLLRGVAILVLEDVDGLSMPEPPREVAVIFGDCQVRRWLIRPDSFPHLRAAAATQLSPAPQTSGRHWGDGTMAANVAAELTLALNGLRVFAENVRFTTYWVNAIYEALGHKPGFFIRPLSDLVSDLLPEGDTVGLLERAEVRSRELCPHLPHIVSTARRSMLALHVLVDWLEIGQLFEMRACTSSDSRAD